MDISTDQYLPQELAHARRDQLDSAGPPARTDAKRDMRRLIQFRWLVVNAIMTVLLIAIDLRYQDHGLSRDGFALAVRLRLLMATPLILLAIGINRWSTNRQLQFASNGFATIALVITATLISRQLQEPLASRYMMGTELLIFGAALFAALPWRETVIMIGLSSAAYAAIVSGVLQYPHAAANLDLVVFNFPMTILALYTRKKMDDQMKKIKVMRRIDAERTEELRKANSMLSKISNTDALTGAFNRRYLDSFAAKRSTSIVPSRGSGVLMIDVDHFKLFNDHAGHAEGDRCLQLVAAAIQKTMRSNDDFVVRYGGEEFATILPAAGNSETFAIAERVRHAVSDLQLQHPGLTPGAVVTVSIGASVASPEDSIFEAIQRADKFLYAAKKHGRNRVAA
jgi:diguanylate cyclase (GGDEF)-like protein